MMGYMKEEDTMIDAYIASWFAPLEYEERMQALVRDEPLIHDIRSDGDEVWATHSVGSWQFPHVGALLWALAWRWAWLR
jgi:hypothetical protein